MIDSLHILHPYTHVTKKLKKRSFFRKVNFNEAIDAYTKLFNLLRSRNESEEYCAIMLVALAKCYFKLKNYHLEAVHFERAARGFLSSELELRCQNAPSSHEFEEIAIRCYFSAIDVYLNTKQFNLAASLLYELAQACLDLNRTFDASYYFVSAAELQQTNNLIDAMVSLRKSCDCHISLGNLSHCTFCLQWIIKLAIQHSTNNDRSNNDDGSFVSEMRFESTLSSILILILQADYDQARILTKYFEKEQILDEQQETRRNFLALQVSQNYVNCNEDQDSDHALGPKNLLQRRDSSTKDLFAQLQTELSSFNTQALHTDMYHTNEMFFQLIHALIDAVEFCLDQQLFQIQSELCPYLTPSQNTLLQKFILHNPHMCS